MQQDSLTHTSKSSKLDNDNNAGVVTPSSKTVDQVDGSEPTHGLDLNPGHPDESFGSLNDLYLSESVGTLDTNNDSSRTSPSAGVMSDRVQRIASSIYAEFEAMIEAYGLPVVERLMPLVIGLLENLDELYKDQSAYHEEVYQLREHNTFMVGELEREKERRKQAELRLIHTEDAFDEERKLNEAKLETLNLNCRQAELKYQNMKDQFSRMEAKEAEWKKESQRLHEHINELIRSKLDLADQVKFANRPSSGKTSGRSTGPVRLGSSAAPTLGIVVGLTGEGDSQLHQPQENMYDATSGGFGFDEMPSADVEGIPLDEELPDDPVTPTTAGDYETGAFAGMRREIDILIKENMELVETKNALNVVKDDLITKLDTLNFENASLRESVSHLTQSRSTLQSELASTNQLLSEARHELEEFRDRLATPSGRFESVARESGSDSMHRKRFTRAEMARVLSERNQYKERLMELQEAVRLSETLRAGQKGHPELLVGLSSSSAASRSGAVLSGQATVPTRPLQTLQNLFAAFLAPSRTDSTTERPETPTAHNVKLRGQVSGSTVSHAWVSLSHTRTGSPIYGWSRGLDSPLSKRSPSASRVTCDGTGSAQTVPVPVQCRAIGGIHGKQLEIVSALLVPLPTSGTKSEYQLWLVGRGPGYASPTASPSLSSPRGFVGQVHVFELSRFSQPVHSFDLDNGFMPTAAVYVERVPEVAQTLPTTSPTAMNSNPDAVVSFEWEIFQSGLSAENGLGYVMLASNDGRFMILQVPVNRNSSQTNSADSAPSAPAQPLSSLMLTRARFLIRNASLVSNCMIAAGGSACLGISNPSGVSQLCVFRLTDSIRAAEEAASTSSGNQQRQQHELVAIPGDCAATGPVVMALETTRAHDGNDALIEVVWLGTAGGGHCHALDPRSGKFIKDMKLPEETPCLHAITVQLQPGAAYNTIWLAVSGCSGGSLDGCTGVGSPSSVTAGDNSRGMARLLAFRTDTLTVIYQLDLTSPLCSMIDTDGVTDPIDLTLCRLLAVSDAAVDNIWFATRSGIIGRFPLPVSTGSVPPQGNNNNKPWIPSTSSLSISCHGYRRPVSNLLTVKLSNSAVDAGDVEQFVIAVGHDYVNLRPKQLRSPVHHHHQSKTASNGSYRLRPMGSGAHIIMWKLDMACG